MQMVTDGQCGLCAHFGERKAMDEGELVGIVLSKEAEEALLEECGHPKHVDLHLKVTPISGCDGFELAEAA